MKTWEAIDDVAGVNPYPRKPLGLAGRAAVNCDLGTIALVVPAITGN
jgi:hypothetical protein